MRIFNYVWTHINITRARKKQRGMEDSLGNGANPAEVYQESLEMEEVILSISSHVGVKYPISPEIETLYRAQKAITKEAEEKANSH